MSHNGGGSIKGSPEFWQAMMDSRDPVKLQSRITQLEQDKALLVEQLDGLIMEVACKYPGESRYETAKRYIHERENRPSTPAQQAQVADSKEGDSTTPDNRD